MSSSFDDLLEATLHDAAASAPPRATDVRWVVGESRRRTRRRRVAGAAGVLVVALALFLVVPQWSGLSGERLQPAEGAQFVAVNDAPFRWTRPTVVGVPGGFFVWGVTGVGRMSSDSVRLPPPGEVHAALLDTRTGAWREVAAGPLGSRFGVSGSLVDGEVVLVGGATSQTSQDRRTEVAAFSLAEESWRMLPPLPEGRNRAQSVEAGGRLVVAGGGTATGRNESAVLVLETGGWRQLDVGHPVDAVLSSSVGVLLMGVGYGDNVTKVVETSLLDPGSGGLQRLARVPVSQKLLHFALGTARDATPLLGLADEEDGNLYELAFGTGGYAWEPVLTDVEGLQAALGGEDMQPTVGGFLTSAADGWLAVTGDKIHHIRVNGMSGQVVTQGGTKGGAECRISVTEFQGKALFLPDEYCDAPGGPKLLDTSGG